MIGMTVCSGIGAPERAAPWIDWRYQSEIEKFPSAVLAERFPDAVNLGDMTKFKEWPDATIDVLCGGTPCQSFSVAGLRKGLADPRGNLALTYLAIAARYRPRWLVWENVPGVLSALSHAAPDPCQPEIDLDSEDGPRDGAEVVVTDEYRSVEDHALWCFMAGAAELGYHGGFCTLDVQHVQTPSFERAVPQRRERVFFVGYLGDWRRAAAVLFEPESLSGHPPPRREAGKATPSRSHASAKGSCSVTECGRPARKRGWCNTHYQRWRKHGYVADTPIAEPGKSDDDRFWEKVEKTDHCWNWTAALHDKGYGVFWNGSEQRLVRAHRFSYEAVHGEIPEGLEIDHLCRNRKCVRPDHLEAVTSAENTRRGNAGKHWSEKRGEFDVTPCLAARTQGGGGLGTDFELDGGLVANTLKGEGFDASEDGTGRQNLVPVANSGDVSHCLTASAQNSLDAETETLIAFDCKGTQVQTDESGAYTIEARNKVQAVAFPTEMSGTQVAASPNLSPALNVKHSMSVALPWAVRRLTPRECERLMGFPDGWTQIPWRGKPADQCPDGPRYKALGNSWGVNCGELIFDRIRSVEELHREGIT